jgi:hypothetical protein
MTHKTKAKQLSREINNDIKLGVKPDMEEIVKQIREVRSKRELELLYQSKNDVENSRLTTYTSHREILGR